MSDCVFCDILAGEAESSRVYEDDRLVGFMDLHPINPGHVLLVPREHASSMSEVDEDTGAHVFRVAMRMQQAVRTSGLRTEGINVFVADGEAAGQDVFHFHLHVIPRFDGDPFTITANWKEAPRAELDRTAEQIRAAYEERWA